MVHYAFLSLQFLLTCVYAFCWFLMLPCTPRAGYWRSRMSDRRGRNLKGESHIRSINTQIWHKHIRLTRSTKVGYLWQLFNFWNDSLAVVILVYLIERSSRQKGLHEEVYSSHALLLSVCSDKNFINKTLMWHNKENYCKCHCVSKKRHHICHTRFTRPITSINVILLTCPQSFSKMGWIISLLCSCRTS